MSKSSSIWPLATHSGGGEDVLRLPPHWFVGTSRRAEGSPVTMVTAAQSAGRERGGGQTVLTSFMLRPGHTPASLKFLLSGWKWDDVGLGEAK